MVPPHADEDGGIVVATLVGGFVQAGCLDGGQAKLAHRLAEVVPHDAP